LERIASTTYTAASDLLFEPFRAKNNFLPGDCMFTQNELDFDDHPICSEFPGASSINGWDYIIDGHAFTGKFVSATEFWSGRKP